MARALVLTLAATAWSAVPGLAQAVQTASSVTAASVRADFDNDGFADLAVGVSAEDVGTIVDAGAVNMLYGAAGGLSGSGSQLFTQASPGVVDAAETGDRFARNGIRAARAHAGSLPARVRSLQTQQRPRYVGRLPECGEER